MEQEIGARLRGIRLKLDLTQRALAKRACVPSSTISLIEGGRTNPSIGSLKRILNAAGMTLADFFNFDLTEDTQIFFRHDELSEIARGSVSYRQVGAGRNNSLQILYEVYQPGSDSGRVLLSHEGEEGGVIIQGRLEVTVGERTRVLKAGDAYLFPSTNPHRFRNIGDTVCIVVSACTPPTF